MKKEKFTKICKSYSRENKTRFIIVKHLQYIFLLLKYIRHIYVWIYEIYVVQYI